MTWVRATRSESRRSDMRKQVPKADGLTQECRKFTVRLMDLEIRFAPNLKVFY